MDSTLNLDIVPACAREQEKCATDFINNLHNSVYNLVYIRT